MTLHIDHAVTSGTFSLDGQTFDVDNNAWVIGTDTECYVIDAPHDVDAVKALVNGRKVLGILCTHGHDDHVSQAPALAQALNTCTMLNPDDRVLWDMANAEGPDQPLADCERLCLGGSTLRLIHTPGHTPGSMCVYVEDLGVVFTGDTLFQGGPGATGRSYSDFDTIIESISKRLLTLPADTRVLPGHGAETTIGAEAPHLQEWISRGH